MSTSAAVLRAGGPRKPGVSTWENLRGLWPYLGRYKGAIALGLVTLAIMGLIGVIVPLATGIITDAVAGSARPFERVAPGVNADIGALEWLSNHIPYYQASSRGTLGFYCLVIVACIALKGLMSFLTRWVLIGVSRDIEFDIRSDLLDRLLVMEPEFYVRNRTGELMSRATNDLNSVRMVLGPGIMYTATTLVTMVLAVLLMFRLSPSLSLWVLIPVPIVVVAVRYFGRTIHSLYEVIQAALATLSAKAQENLA